MYKKLVREMAAVSAMDWLDANQPEGCIGVKKVRFQKPSCRSVFRQTYVRVYLKHSAEGVPTVEQLVGICTGSGVKLLAAVTPQKETIILS